MKHYNIDRILGILIFAVFTSSCSSDLDFNQVNEAKLEPVVVANLTYFDVPANAFVENGIEYNLAFDAQDFNVFRDKYFRSYLQKVDCFFEVTNTINRAFSIDILLLDQNDDLLYPIHFDIPAYSGSTTVIKKIEIFENVKLDLLKNTKRMGFSLAMAPGPALDKNSKGSIKLRSSATVYLTIE